MEQETYIREEALPAKQRVLVIENEESVSKSIALYFEKSGFDVAIRADGLGVVNVIKLEKPDIVILSLMLPRMDAVDVCKEIRKTSNIPIIILSAKVDEVDRVLGLEMGADDYVTKPFSTRELLARVKAVLRRATYIPSLDEQQSLTLPGIVINRISREAKIEGHRIELTPKEFDLLWYLASNGNRVFTRGQLLEHVWAYKVFNGDERTVDQHIKRLRRKVEIAGSPCKITTIWGVGYKFEIREPALNND